MHIYCNIDALRLKVVHILSSSLYFYFSYDKKIKFLSAVLYIQMCLIKGKIAQ